MALRLHSSVHRRARFASFVTSALVSIVFLAPRHCQAGNLRRLVSLSPTTEPAGPAQTFDAADLPLKADGAKGDMAEWLKPFEVNPQHFTYTLQLVQDEENLQFYRLVFASPVNSPWPENNIVPCEFYVPKAPAGQVAGRVPAAIVLDILDGSAIVPRGMARGLAEQGVAALYVPMACFGARRPKGDVHFKAMINDPNQAVANVRQTIMDIRRAKAILAARPEVDPHRLAITGVSLGGIMTSLAAGVDGQFDRVVPILAGGDLADIIFSARETRVMKRAMDAKGISREQAERFLAPIDPVSFASRIAPGSCLMINAAHDEVIPKVTTEALYKAIGAPSILWTPLGHYSSIWYLPNIRQSTIDFILGRDVKSLEAEVAK